MKRIFAAAISMVAMMAGAGQAAPWVADLGNGTYRNPILYADYSDPDAIRVGDTYYMTSSSFNCVPGLQILTSHDLVNWTLSGAALPDRIPGGAKGVYPQHGNQVWAPSIRHHDGMFYIFYGDPDRGIYQLHTRTPLSRWSEPQLVIEGKGLIDPTPLWDTDGRCYLVHALAGSRAGLKSVLCMAELNATADTCISRSRIIFDGHADNPTCEGPKLYKRNGYYYIFTPAGGVSTGWQLVLRSRHIYGPYEQRVVLRQGDTPVNAPHQGAWVDTETGEDWFLHFQDIGAVGRIVHLQPMRWQDDWPVIGDDPDGDGCGQPVLTHTKPRTRLSDPIGQPQESDSFDSTALGLQWQWHAQPLPSWYFCDAAAGHLRLYSVPASQADGNLWETGNLLMQKISGPDYTATAHVRFHPSAKRLGERAGLVVMGRDYAGLIFEQDKDGTITLSQVSCIKADKGTAETAHAIMQVSDGQDLYLRASLHTEPAAGDYQTTCTFSYSTDGADYQTIDLTFKVREGLWIGAKTGLFCTSRQKSNDCGWMDVESFDVAGK